MTSSTLPLRKTKVMYRIPRYSQNAIEARTFVKVTAHFISFYDFMSRRSNDPFLVREKLNHNYRVWFDTFEECKAVLIERINERIKSAIKDTAEAKEDLKRALKLKPEIRTEQ